MKRIVLLLCILSPVQPSFRSQAADTGTASIRIEVSGLDIGDRSLYDVLGPDGEKLYSIALEGIGSGNSVSRCIKGLAPGRYMVRPTDWAWAYEQFPESLELSVSPGNTAVFKFTAFRRTGLKPHWEDGKLNRFSLGVGTGLDVD